MQIYPNFMYEKRYWKQDYKVIGIDEVGRGALAGPVFVGAFMFDVCSKSIQKFLLTHKINDSKKLSQKKREALYTLFLTLNVSFAVAQSEVHIINDKGIVFAICQAARQAIQKVTQRNPGDYFLLADALTLDDIPGVKSQNQLAIIKGDQKSISIAAASIVAKVLRDRYMKRLASKYEGYYWEQNKGYGTIKHRESILLHGLTVHHRTLFLRKVLHQ